MRFRGGKIIKERKTVVENGAWWGIKWLLNTRERARGLFQLRIPSLIRNDFPTSPTHFYLGVDYSSPTPLPTFPLISSRDPNYFPYLQMVSPPTLHRTLHYKSNDALKEDSHVFSDSKEHFQDPTGQETNDTTRPQFMREGYSITIHKIKKTQKLNNKRIYFGQLIHCQEYTLILRT